jgi:uncharacterized protein
MLPSPRLILLALAVALLAAPRPGLPAEAPAQPAAVDAAYQKEIDAWRRERVEELKKEDGWLTLVGLFWLQEGENRFGSDPGKNRVIFPAGKAPAMAGTFLRQGDAVQVRIEPGVEITVDGKPLPPGTPTPLKADTTGEPTVLHLGSLSFHVIKRGDRMGIRAKDSKSPALAAFHGLDDFSVDPAWRVVARFEPYTPAKKVPIPNVLGMVTDTPSPGAVVFERGGKTYRLDALQDSPEGGLFLIFADPTNGHETYGAGRFLSTDPPKDGKVVVDFNKAYNPPCAFTSFATCPLPPAQNHLALRVEAGEKRFAGGHH